MKLDVNELITKNYHFSKPRSSKHKCCSRWNAISTNLGYWYIINPITRISRNSLVGRAQGLWSKGWSKGCWFIQQCSLVGICLYSLIETQRMTEVWRIKWSIQCINLRQGFHVVYSGSSNSVLDKIPKLPNKIDKVPFTTWLKYTCTSTIG